MGEKGIISQKPFQEESGFRKQTFWRDILILFEFCDLLVSFFPKRLNFSESGSPIKTRLFQYSWFSSFQIFPKNYRIL